MSYWMFMLLHISNKKIELINCKATEYKIIKDQWNRLNKGSSSLYNAWRYLRIGLKRRSIEGSAIISESKKNETLLLRLFVCQDVCRILLLRLMC